MEIYTASLVHTPIHPLWTIEEVEMVITTETLKKIPERTGRPTPEPGPIEEEK